MKKILRIFIKISYQILAPFRITKEYYIGEVKLKLPIDHYLPIYQNDHPLYDRFLQCLTKHFSDGEIIIDVGANVGDTVASLLSKETALNFICVEADKYFYSLLYENIKQIKKTYNKNNFYCQKAFVGSKITNVSMDGIRGTKKAILNGDIKSITLDKLVKDLNIKKDKIRLIKVDVDGYDYDVINSAQMICENLPFLYFETHFENDDQLSGYKLLLKSLFSKGYKNYFIFDNYGGLVCVLNEIMYVCELFDYTMRQNRNESTRTIYYYDILACSEADLKIAEFAAKDHLTC